MRILFTISLFMVVACKEDSFVVRNGMLRTEVERHLGRACDEKMVPFKDNSGKAEGMANLVIYADEEEVNFLPEKVTKLTPCGRFRAHSAAGRSSRGNRADLPPYPKLLRAVYYKQGKVRKHERLRY
jgi:hypothetical protein